MADLAIGLAKTVVEGALTRAQSAIEEETKLRQSTQQDLVFITGEFEMMHSFLEVANTERVRNNVVKTWVRQVRDLAYDVEDCIEFVVHLDDDSSSKWRRMLPSCFAVAPLPLDVAVAEIEQLKARVEDVSCRNSRYNLISDSGSKPVVVQQQTAPNAAVTTTVVVDTISEPRDTAKKQPGLGDLTQLITKGGSDLGVISVWSRSDDLGTMSVIRKAYEDEEISKTFGCRGWVKLEYPFNPRKFQQTVLAQFYTNTCLQQRKNVDAIELERREAMVMKQGGFVEEFKSQVNNKRYLLVLENVCTMGDWDAIRACLPESVNSNRIIVSTEQREVARLCIGHSYQVLEIKQYSADYPVCVFFKQGFHGEIDRVMSTDVIHDVNNRVYTRIHTTRREAARCCTEEFMFSGREAEMKELRSHQTKARFNDWQVMSVWGIAGVGKSSLVRNFYSDTMLEEENPPFHKYGWIDVTQPLNLMDFSRKVLLEFNSESQRHVEIKDPIQQCCKFLKECRCLLVIDGLQSKEEWDLIQNSLVSRHSKSLIIVITTQENIATYCADNEEVILNIRGLEAEAAFHLLKEKVLRKKPSSAVKEIKYEDLKQLILKCGGLPKVIVAISDFLAPKTVKFMESATALDKKFMHELEGNPEFICLRQLFDWMHCFFLCCPDFLRPCIFYLSIFPGYQIIRRRRLVMRWVAEGYSRDTKDNTSEERAEMLFSMLVNLSMIQPPPCTVMTHMRMVKCQVSAFFHEYIISRPDEQNIVFALEVFELKGRCRPSTRRTGRHLVIHENWDRDKIVYNSIDFSRLRSLTVFGKWKSFFVSESMKVLRVLDLEDASDVTDKDLELIVKLLPRLKLLSLRGRNEINRLPSSLGELRQLETLDVRGTSIDTFPASITKLKKLQYIRAGASSLSEERSCASKSCFPIFCRPRQLGVEVPAGIDKLTALHTLGVVNVAIGPHKATLKELKTLTQLRKLGVSGVNKKNCKEVSEAISCQFHLESLSLWLSKDDQYSSEDLRTSRESSSPLENLRTLKLYGLVNFVPSWIKDLQKLTKLELEMTISNNWIEESRITEVLGDIKELSVLRLCVKPLHDGDSKLDFCVWLNGVHKSCYLRVNILEVACSSNVKLVFGSHSMQNLELLTVRCSNPSALEFCELKSLPKLKEVQLIGAQDRILEDLRTQLNKHPRRPVLKFDEASSS